MARRKASYYEVTTEQSIFYIYLYIILVVSSVLLLSDTEHLMLYIILVVPLLVCWKNQVRCTSVARAYLGLFFFFLFSSRRTGRPCLLAFDTAEHKLRKVWIPASEPSVTRHFSSCFLLFCPAAQRVAGRRVGAWKPPCGVSRAPAR